MTPTFSAIARLRVHPLARSAVLAWIGVGCAASDPATSAAERRAREPSPSSTPAEVETPAATNCPEVARPSPSATTEVQVEVEVDLCDDWAPRVLSPPDVTPPAYRAVYVALANERWHAPGVPTVAHNDRYFELFGIPPSPSVVGARLGDHRRHACHDTVDDRALAETSIELVPDDRTPERRRTRERAMAVRAVEAHLACDGLLARRRVDGVFDGATWNALGQYQRHHAIVGVGHLDAATRAALLEDSRELETRVALRMLRERVVDATGLLADGSASNAWQPVLGRALDPAQLRDPLGRGPIPAGAPDSDSGPRPRRPHEPWGGRPRRRSRRRWPGSARRAGCRCPCPPRRRGGASPTPYGWRSIAATYGPSPRGTRRASAAISRSTSPRP